MVSYGDFISHYPFIVVTVIACLVFGTSMTLLVWLIVKGWRTNTMKGYFLVYLLLLNMSIVWAC